MNLVSLGTIIRASALLVIVFGSSYFGSIVDMMGSSAATRQVLDPNRVPVSNVRGRFRSSSSSLLILLGRPLYLLSLRAMPIGTRVSRSLDGTHRESPHLSSRHFPSGHFGRRVSHHESPPPPPQTAEIQNTQRMGLPDHVARREQTDAIRGHLEADHRNKSFQEGRGRRTATVGAAVGVLRPPIPRRRLE